MPTDEFDAIGGPSDGADLSVYGLGGGGGAAFKGQTQSRTVGDMPLDSGSTAWQLLPGSELELNGAAEGEVYLVMLAAAWTAAAGTAWADVAVVVDGVISRRLLGGQEPGCMVGADFAASPISATLMYDVRADDVPADPTAPVLLQLAVRNDSAGERSVQGQADQPFLASAVLVAHL